MKILPRPFVVESVDDPIFAPELGEMGVYHPTQFLAKTQSWVFSVGTPDFSKSRSCSSTGSTGRRGTSGH